MQHYHTKLLCQKPILRQIVQEGSVAKNGVLPVITLDSQKF